ncbi:DNA-3-methyladenine glycosylase [Cellulosilyticum ruminicola]|uniref:DNA-3-methyladenine glycosylase n=1 Tax=Cellulosilyticum ruminicola TaxID=425254 RepID=UPI0006D22611|nr:DNA-3-methyladenine glycosylase [Cellulosilyticum ruminicola]
MSIVKKDFYIRESIKVARDLLGKILVRRIEEEEYRFKIVETEAYMGKDDKGAHAYAGKKTPRTAPMFEEGGITYIYLIYGMYNCLNIVTNVKDTPQGVLIRAVEPMDEKSIGFARANRNVRSKKIEDLTNGPGKLCKAMKIDKTLNATSVLGKGELWIEEAPMCTDIVADKRINIPYAEEYQNVEWRFYIRENSFVSVLKKE